MVIRIVLIFFFNFPLDQVPVLVLVCVYSPCQRQCLEGWVAPIRVSVDMARYILKYQYSGRIPDMTARKCRHSSTNLKLTVAHRLQPFCRTPPSPEAMEERSSATVMDDDTV